MADSVLNECLRLVIDWMMANKLKVNPEALLVGVLSTWGCVIIQHVLNEVALHLKDQVHHV